MIRIQDYLGIVFDLDGTLLNTLPTLTQSVNAALAAQGFPVRSEAEIRSFIGDGIVLLMQRALPQKVSEEVFAECLHRFRTHYKTHMLEGTAPYAGIVELVDTLHQWGVQLTVVSNKFDSATNFLIDYFFPDRFVLAVGTSDTVPRKPSPEGVLFALEKLGLLPSQVLYLGDSEVDVQTAQRVGTDFVGVSWGFRDIAALQKAGAKYWIDTPAQLLHDDVQKKD